MGEPECGWDFELSPTPRLRNRSTQHQPLVAHGCGGHGRWFLSDVYRELGLIDACFAGHLRHSWCTLVYFFGRFVRASMNLVPMIH